MKKNILAISIMMISLAAISQNDTVSIPGVEVSAHRVPALYSETSRVITVISREEIRNAPVQDIQELLEYAANVDVRQRSHNGVQADVSIRGGTSEQTLILLNGVKINDPQTGHHNMNIPVDIESIERIEILEGPGSRIYGPNAFSGAINIITNSEDKSRLRASLSGGEFGYWKANISGNIKAGQTSHFISAGKKKSGGYIKNTDFDIINTFLHSNFKFNNAKADLQAGYQEKAFGANSFYTAKYPDQFEATKTIFTHARLHAGKKIKVTPGIYWRRHQDRFELFRYDRPAWYTKHNYHLTSILGAEANFNMTTRFGKTALGLEGRNEHIYSNVLGDPMEKKLNVAGEKNAVFTKSKSRDNFSIFFEHAVFSSKINFFTGFLANWNSQFGWYFYPGIDASFNMNKKNKFFASVNKTMRIPTFTDLYYSGPTNIGNPDLKPEEALTYETGYKYNSRVFETTVAVFYRKGNNLIDWGKLAPTDTFQSMNLTELNTRGFEISATLYPSRIATRKFLVTQLHLGYSFLESDKESGEYISVYVLDHLKHKLNFTLKHKIFKNISASWLVSWQDRAGYYTEHPTMKEVAFKPFWLVNGRISWTNKIITCYTEASNLLNSAYYDIGNIAMPGIWIKAGLVFNLDFDSKKKSNTFKAE